jgi:hypothetical protein
MMLKTLLLGAVGAPLALVLPAAADLPVPGFGLDVLADPAALSATATRSLSSGDFLAANGSTVRLFGPNGVEKAVLATFPASGVAGFVVVSADERFALAGEPLVGHVLLLDLQLGTSQAIAKLPGCFDAAFETSNTVLISAAGCVNGCGNDLVRVDLNTGAVRGLVNVASQPGAIALEPGGDLLYATRATSGGASAIHRFTAGELALAPPVFYEDNGLVVVEIEADAPSEQWSVETADVGYGGDSYYRWNGPNFFGSPGAGLLEYDLVIENPGRYEFILHNKHDNPQSDQENDVWVRMDNGPWLKAFSNGGFINTNKWNWLTWFDYSGAAPNEQAYYDLGVGQHRLQISARSYNFKIDRFHLYRSFVVDPADVDEAESPRGLELADASPVASGYQDLLDLERAPNGNLFAADFDVGSNRGRLTLLPAGSSSPTLLGLAELGERADDLRFFPGSGPAVFLPYQPAYGGRLDYQGLIGTTVSDRRGLRPARPMLHLSGPGTTGSGAVQANVSGAPANSFVVFVAAPAGAVLPAEAAVPGLPFVLTPLSLPSVVLLPGVAPVSAAGTAVGNYANPSGQTNVIAVQGLVFTLDALTFTASTTVDVL